MDRNDPDRDAYLFADYANRLEGVTELEVSTACEHFVEKVPDPFFPAFAALNEFLASEFSRCTWSKFSDEPAAKPERR